MPVSSFTHMDTDGRRLPQNHRQKALGNGSLLISDVQKNSDWGRYECLVFDEEGHSVRRDLFVNVMGKRTGEQERMREEKVPSSYARMFDVRLSVSSFFFSPSFATETYRSMHFSTPSCLSTSSSYIA